MSNIVISIISIVLVTALVLGGFYYMGPSTNDKKVEADAAKLRNEAVQISSAVKLYQSEGNSFGPDFRIERLVELGYLKELPKNWEPGEDKIMHVLNDPENSERICFIANRQAGYTFDAADTDVIPYSENKNLGIPSCNKAGLSALVPCCSN